MRLYLIRHGETEYNHLQVMQGHAEIPLNDTGISQAASLGVRMAGMPLDQIYASDLRRATMTACIVGAYTGAPIEYVEGFRERDPGDLTHEKYENAMPFFNDLEYTPPNGESVPVFADRVRKAFGDLCAKEGATQRAVAVVSHGMVCRAFLHVCLGQSHDQTAAASWPNASLTIADYDGAWNLVMAGDASHLEDAPQESRHETGG